MRSNLVDLIVLLARHVRMGENLADIKDDSLKKYDKSEISAAYSWILQQYPAIKKKDIPNPEAYHRVLHFAERLLISPEAYGYLLELVNIGLIDSKALEGIIERVMFHSSERIGIDKIKRIVATTLFELDANTRNQSTFLRGNESVN
jgi:uncharacterized protein Smg (DUF494 family)